MNLQDWQLLLELYNSKSISRASETLFVSQPALTRRLKQIEEEFSTIITIRSSKGITFTPQGERLVEYSRDMLQQYQQIKKRLGASEKISGTIQLASSLSQTQFFLPTLLQNFSLLHPGISFEVETNLSSICAKALNTHKVPVALFRGNHQGNFQQKLLSSHYGYIVSCQPFALAELPDMPYISFDSDHTSNNIRENWWYDTFDTTPYTAMSVTNGNICYEMICHGMGYGIFLNTDFWAHNKSLYYMQMFYKDGSPIIRNDWIAYRTESLQLEQVSSFVDYTVQYAGELNQSQKIMDTMNF